MTRFRDRSTSDLLVIIVGSTICIVVLIGAIGLILEGLFGNAENPGAITLVSDTLVALTSLLAGFVAGRTDGRIRDRREERKDEDDAPPA